MSHVTVLEILRKEWTIYVLKYAHEKQLPALIMMNQNFEDPTIQLQEDEVANPEKDKRKGGNDLIQQK